MPFKIQLKYFNLVKYAQNPGGAIAPSCSPLRTPMLSSRNSLFLNRGFPRKESAIYVIYQISDRKTEKVLSMTKKGHQKFVGIKIDIFSKKRSFENFSVPPPKLGAKFPDMRILCVCFSLSVVFHLSW